MSWRELSPVARHALVVSCMAANTPVPLSDPATVERVASLLRPVSQNSKEGPGVRTGPSSLFTNTASDSLTNKSWPSSSREERYRES